GAAAAARTWRCSAGNASETSSRTSGSEATWAPLTPGPSASRSPTSCRSRGTRRPISGSRPGWITTLASGARRSSRHPATTSASSDGKQEEKDRPQAAAAAARRAAAAVVGQLRALARLAVVAQPADLDLAVAAAVLAPEVGVVALLAGQDQAVAAHRRAHLLAVLVLEAVPARLDLA